MSGNLATALADFQGRVGAVPRTREVTVQLKTGGQYKFKYAPHEAIIEAIRSPLAAAGLSVSQQLSTTPDGDPALRTILLHSSGEKIEDTFPLPTRDGMTVQELGSAITYIRRYALSAILGLATDDDDDGNHASGTTVTTRRDRDEPRDGSIIGEIARAKSPWDLEIRQTPSGNAYGFKLTGGRQQIRVTATGDLADALALLGSDALLGKRATCFGRITPDTWVVGKEKIPYTRLDLSRIETPDFTLPAGADAAVAAGSSAGTAEPSQPQSDDEAWKAAHPELALLP